MIISVGIDMIEISRIENILNSKSYFRFLNRILTDEEKAELKELKNNQNIVRFVANRFAIKESLAKALGHGIGKIRFSDIHTMHDKNGKPYIKKNLPISEIIRKTYHIISFDIQVSVSDTKNNSVAVVIISTS